MNKKMAVLLGCFVLCFGFMIYADYSGVLKQPEQIQVLPESSVPEEITEERPEESLSGTKLPPAPDLPEEPVKSLNDWFIPIITEEVPNNEVQKYVLRNTKMEGSQITFTADRFGETYLSGQVESRQAFCYGSMTFRVPVARGKGLFPAIWMLPADGNKFPEVDIMEQLGQTPYKIYHVLHYAGKNSSGIKQQKIIHTEEFPRDQIPDSYLLRFVWEPGKMSWYLNGQLTYTLTEQVPSVPMYLIMNLAVGGDWPGQPDQNTEFPYPYQIELLEYDIQNITTR